MTARLKDLVAVLGVVALGVVGGLVAGPSATAGWTTSLSATGTVAAGTVSLTSTPANVARDVLNQTFQVTQRVTVTNTQASTTFTGPSTVTVTALPSASPAPALSALMNVTVWQVATTAACTAAVPPPAGSPSGLWSTGVTSTPVPLTRSQSAIFCVRGSAVGAPADPAAANQNRPAVASAIATSTGAQTFTPRYQATLSLGSFTRTVAGNSTAIRTVSIFPFQTVSATGYFQVRPVNATTLCLDVNGGFSSAVGSRVDVFGCHTQTTDPAYGNQFIRMIPVAGTNAVALKARMSPATNGYFQASGTASGSGVTVQNANTASTLQQWMPQRTNGTTTPAQYQLVNASSGLCLTAPTSAGAITQTSCTAATSQRFTWTAVGVAFP